MSCFLRFQHIFQKTNKIAWKKRSDKNLFFLSPIPNESQHLTSPANHVFRHLNLIIFFNVLPQNNNHFEMTKLESKKQLCLSGNCQSNFSFCIDKNALRVCFHFRKLKNPVLIINFCFVVLRLFAYLKPRFVWTARSSPLWYHDEISRYISHRAVNNIGCRRVKNLPFMWTCQGIR